MEMVDNKGNWLHTIVEIHVGWPHSMEIFRNVLLDVPHQTLKASTMQQVGESVLHTKSLECPYSG